MQTSTCIPQSYLNLMYESVGIDDISLSTPHDDVDDVVVEVAPTELKKCLNRTCY